MTVPFGALDRIGILKALFPSPQTIQPDVAKAIKQPTKLEKAQRELHLYGTTEEQRAGYIPRVSEVLYRNIIPGPYEQSIDAKSLIRQVFGLKPVIEVPTKLGEPISSKQRFLAAPGQEDSWRLYLGLPQQNKTFSVSPYKPSQSKEDKYYFKINGFFDNLLGAPGDVQVRAAANRGDVEFVPYATSLAGKETPALRLKKLVKAIEKEKTGRLQINDDLSADISTGGVMRNFQLSKGKDEKGHYIAVYDKWDLKSPHADKIGRPYEIYDRLYYDPETFAPLPDTQFQSVVPSTGASNAKRRK